jgi:hypothetical protein
MRTQLIFALSAVLLAEPLSAQTAAATIVSDRSTCQVCRIERYRLVTVTDSTFPAGALVGPALLYPNADGTFFLVAGPGMQELFAVDRKGNITRRIGRKGQGPGEFMMPLYVLETTTTYVVFDTRLQRMTHLSKNGLRVDRTVAGPKASLFASPVALVGGMFAMTGEISTRERTRKPLHFLAAGGRVLQSFGNELDAAGLVAAPIALAASRDGGVWVAYPNRYRIEKWDREGNLARVYERHVDWFAPRGPDPVPAGERFATVQGIHEDAQGHLWVHLALRRKVGRPAVTQRGREPPRNATVARLDADPAYNESVIDVIDPVTASLVASLRVPSWRASSTAGAGLFLQVQRSSTGGQPLLEVWGFRLLGDF